MKMAFAAAELGALMVVVTILTGCATPQVRPSAATPANGPRLWDNRLYQPAEHPGLALALSQDGNDVLVCYDERCEESLKTYRRAYWLFAYNAQSNNIVKPQFTSPAAYKRLNPIAVVDVGQTNAAPANGYYAITSTDSRSFQLCREGQTVGGFNLPAYEAGPPGTWWRVGVTAAAVVAVIGVYGLAGLGAGAGP